MPSAWRRGGVSLPTAWRSRRRPWPGTPLDLAAGKIQPAGPGGRAGEFAILIEVAHQGRVAVVTMAHGKANAMDVELCEGIARRFAELAASPARAIVLTGQGRMFSAG